MSGNRYGYVHWSIFSTTSAIWLAINTLTTTIRFDCTARRCSLARRDCCPGGLRDFVQLGPISIFTTISWLSAAMPDFGRPKGIRKLATARTLSRKRLRSYDGQEGGI